MDTGDSDPQLRTEIEAAATAADALRILAGTLARRFRLERVSLRAVDARANRATVVAVWPDAPTRLQPGVSMPLTATAYPSLIEAGGPALPSDDATFAERLLREEGIRSWAVFPLRRYGAVVGMLGVGSLHTGELSVQTVPEVERMVADVEDALVDKLPV